MKPQPLEPLYTLKVAADLIPFRSVEALRVYLCRHPQDFPGRYRRFKHGYQRFLTHTECLKIRHDTVKSFQWPLHKRRNPGS